MIKKNAKLKTLFLLIICLCFSCQTGKSVKKQDVQKEQSLEIIRKYDTPSIVADLSAKANRFDSYAQDYVFLGQAVKRMSFLFKKNGKDFYTYRSDYNNDGVRLIRLFNVDGKYDYDYYPDKKTAFRQPTQVKMSEADYAGRKHWHFNFDGYEVVGETQINNKDCYILEDGKYVITVWKENGFKTSLKKKGDNRQPLEYGNFEYNLDEKKFAIPDGTEIQEQLPTE